MNRITLNIATAAIVVFLIGPLVVIAFGSLTTTPYITFPPQGLTLHWYAQVWHHHDLLEAFAASLIIATSASAIATAIGTLAAIGLNQREAFARETLRAFAVSPPVLPTVVTGVALYNFMQQFDLPSAYPGLIIGHTLITLPHVVRTVGAAIFIRGKDVIELPARQRNIGRVFQSYALFPHPTAAQNVRSGLRCRRTPAREAAQLVDDMLRVVGLQALASRRPGQLSGGQQQVALARALVIKPDLLLLDEALGALDRKLWVEMQTELKVIQRRFGISTIFVTHDQEEAMAMADHIAVMPRAGGAYLARGTVRFGANAQSCCGLAPALRC